MADIEVRSSGGIVRASPADRIVVRVPENATTGYRWSITEVGETLEIVANDFVLPAELIPGAGGERVVVVRPRRIGRGRVALRLQREWEPEPIDRFEFEVDVTT